MTPPVFLEGILLLYFADFKGALKVIIPVPTECFLGWAGNQNDVDV